MLSAIVLGGLLGAATTYAHDSGDARAGYSGRTYESTSGYVQQPQAYGYTGSYGYGTGNYGCGQHGTLHQNLRAEHRDLHTDLRDAHQDVHQELRHERAHGVPSWQIRAEHREAHRDLSEAHQDGHVQLRDDHRSGHFWLRR